MRSQTKTTFALAAVLVAFCLPVIAQVVLPYKNPSLPIETRVKDLLSRMTPEEKFWQCFMIPGELKAGEEDLYKNGIFGLQVSAESKGGNAAEQLLQYNANEDALALAQKINRIQRYFVEKSRLGIPIIAFDEALHGLVRSRATAFPQSIALAASWDTSMIAEVARTIALETKVRGIRQILSPVVNLASDVRWGRTEETYGEDPFLSATMGVAFMGAFERNGIITTPKHFLANVGDGGRDSYPIHWSKKYLRETQLVPFKAAVQQAGSRSIMTAYNSVNGQPSSANPWLLLDVLKKEWGFNGFVISDAGATGGSLVLHKTAKDYPESGAQAINNGMDVIFQTAYDHYKLFMPPFLDGTINKERLDDAVSRVLRAKFELGLFENPYVNEADITKLIDVKKHKAIAEEAARKSIVLLKNEGILPLAENISSIAVIGEDAIKGRLGGYSGPGNGVVSILDGLKSRLPKNTTIKYAAGYTRSARDFSTVSSQYLQCTENGEVKKGLHADYFSNMELTGKPAVSRVDGTVNFHWTLFSPDPALSPDFYAVRWSGQVIAPSTGNYEIGLEGNDGFRLYINNQLHVDKWSKQSFSTATKPFAFEAGKKYDIRIEFKEPAGNATIRLIWNVNVKNDWQKLIADAISTAKQSSVAIVVAGIHEGEFQDRASLALDCHQEELINAVAATGKPVIVLLVGGSAITMNNWLDKVQAVASVWYPGESGGFAVADILTGKANPAGRLPITFPISEAQLPLGYLHKPTGRGDDYHNLSGLPLFPFGYGLSYTQFSYSNMQISPSVIKPSETATVKCTIQNTGKYDGDEVVQLYLHDELASVSRPVIELKGFQRISLKAGESKEVSFRITPEMLTMLDANDKEVIEPGIFRIMIGASSRDLRLKGNLEVK